MLAIPMGMSALCALHPIPIRSAHNAGIREEHP
jgi:hypothetical protein